MSQGRSIAVILIVIGIILFSYEGVIKYRTRDTVIDAGPLHVTAEKHTRSTSLQSLAQSP